MGKTNSSFIGYKHREFTLSGIYARYGNRCGDLSQHQTKNKWRETARIKRKLKSRQREREKNNDKERKREGEGIHGGFGEISKLLILKSISISKCFFVVKR